MYVHPAALSRLSRNQAEPQHPPKTKSPKLRSQEVFSWHPPKRKRRLSAPVALPQPSNLYKSHGYRNLKKWSVNKNLPCAPKHVEPLRRAASLVNAERCRLLTNEGDSLYERQTTSPADTSVVSLGWFSCAIRALGRAAVKLLSLAQSRPQSRAESAAAGPRVQHPDGPAGAGLGAAAFYSCSGGPGKRSGCCWRVCCWAGHEPPPPCCSIWGRGLVGLPVFALGSGGPAPLLGLTGGYLLSYPFAAFVVGYLTTRSERQHRQVVYGAKRGCWWLCCAGRSLSSFAAPHGWAHCCRTRRCHCSRPRCGPSSQGRC